MNQHYLPKDKSDFTSVVVLAGLERSIVIPLLPELLEWLQDMNWPIALDMVDVLLKYRDETISHIRTILSQRDTIWIYNLLAYLIIKWDTELVSKLSSNLRELALSRDDEDTDLLAITILSNHCLMETKESTALLERKWSDIAELLHAFTAEQKAAFSDLDDRKLHLLNTDVKRLLSYVEPDSTILKIKNQYDNLLHRHQEIEATMRSISTIT